jgi:hypothetical protein
MSEQIAERSRLADHREDRGGAGEGLGTELTGQVADLQRDHGAERDRHQQRRHQGHAGDEPGLLEKLAGLERRGEDPLGHLDHHHRNLTGSTNDGHSGKRHSPTSPGTRAAATE